MSVIYFKILYIVFNNRELSASFNLLMRGGARIYIYMSPSLLPTLEVTFQFRNLIIRPIQTTGGTARYGHFSMKMSFC